jgi:hypothetical protein
MSESRQTMYLTGNFEQFGKWSDPDPGFKGHIIVENDGSFIGYLIELYGPVVGMESLHNDSNRIRLITGYIADNNKNSEKGIAFLKLSEDENQSPLMYVVPDIDQEGEWAALRMDSGCFERQGRAKISLEEVIESDEITEKVDYFYRFMRSLNNPVNTQLIDQAYTCLDILRHIE